MEIIYDNQEYGGFYTVYLDYLYNVQVRDLKKTKKKKKERMKNFFIPKFYIHITNIWGGNAPVFIIIFITTF